MKTQFARRATPGAAPAEAPRGTRAGAGGAVRTRADALSELSRTQLLLQLGSLPDLAFESDGFDALSPALQHVTRVIRDALTVDTAGIVLRTPGQDKLVPAAGVGAFATAVTDAEPLLARVFAEDTLLHLHAAVEDASTDVTYVPDSPLDGESQELLCRLSARALMAVPIGVDGEPRGVLYVAHGGARHFGEDDLAFLAVVAGRVGLLLERAELSRAQREIERQRAQAAARQEFLGIVTHELKTPVAVLKAYAELLHDRAEVDGRTEDVAVLVRMEEQAARLLAMVEQVLDLQRIDTGLFPLEVERVDLSALVTRVLDGLRLTAGTGRLRLDVQQGVVVRADRRRLEQVLTNLIQNAIRFSPPGDEVSVAVACAEQLPECALGDVAHRVPNGPLSRNGDAGSAADAPREEGGGSAGWAIVSVSDHGPGVAEHERRRIFHRFYQGQGGGRLHRGHGGLGVGLYVAREIVERHGGAIWLEPTRHDGTNRGATFSFAVPAVSLSKE